MADEPIITATGLGFTYVRAERPALEAVDLEIRPGELVGVIGADGSGKTTLGRCLNGITPHLIPGVRAGTVVVGGRDPITTTVAEMARIVGIVLADPEAQMGQLTVVEEVAFGLENLAVDPAEMPARIAAALASVGLSGLEERWPLTLSGGQQQRLAIASVVAMRPSVLFMDEPTSHLDPIGKLDVFEHARRLSHDEGLTVIVAEHDVELLAAYADRIIALDRGHVALDGSPSEVFGEVDALAAIGLRSPQVTEFAFTLAARDGSLPVTSAEALRWMATPR